MLVIHSRTLWSIGVCVAFAACGGSRTEPELTPGQASQQAATTRKGCDASSDVTLADGSIAYRDECVDRKARLKGSPARTRFEPPRGGASCYRTLLEVVVNEFGEPVMSTVKVVRSTNPDFTNAVLETLRHERYTPALKNKTPVAQWVEVDRSMEMRTVVVAVPAGSAPPAMPPRSSGPSRPSC